MFLRIYTCATLASAALNMSKGAKFTDKDAERAAKEQMALLKARRLTNDGS